MRPYIFSTSHRRTSAYFVGLNFSDHLQNVSSDPQLFGRSGPPLTHVTPLAL